MKANSNYPFLAAMERSRTPPYHNPTTKYTVAQARLYPLVFGQAKPHDRSEQGVRLSSRLERNSLQLRRFYHARYLAVPTCPSCLIDAARTRCLRTGFALLYLKQWIYKNNEKEMDS